MREILKKGNTTVVCIGNTQRGDDAAGPFIASLLKDKSMHRIIDAGVSPENYSGMIKETRPSVILIIDAIRFTDAPGRAGIFRPEELRSGRISTHDLSPGLFIQYLRESTNAEVYILGINPASTELGREISEEVKRSAEEIAAMLR